MVVTCTKCVTAFIFAIPAEMAIMLAVVVPYWLINVLADGDQMAVYEDPPFNECISICRITVQYLE